jgi:hypothetical protein
MFKETRLPSGSTRPSPLLSKLARLEFDRVFECGKKIVAALGRPRVGGERRLAKIRSSEDKPQVNARKDSERKRRVYA